MSEDLLTTRDLRRVVRCLRGALPAGAVRVTRSRPLPDGWDAAAYSWTGGPATIVLRPDLPRPVAVERIVHEYAHVLAWRRHGLEIAEHGHEWGIAYSDAKRALDVEWERRGFDR